jgi:hypothetical protein
MSVVSSYQAGDRVVFRACKRSTHPGPRARHVRPEPSGEGYQYEVDKFWAVREVRGRELVLITRRGKLRVVESDDPALHRATWLERIIYGDRFPSRAGISADADNRERENPESAIFPSPRKG